MALIRESFDASGFDHRVEHGRSRSSELTIATPTPRARLRSDWWVAREVGLTRNVRDLLGPGAKPDARIVPSTFDLVVAPVSAPKDDDPVRPWSSTAGGFERGPFRRSAANSPFQLTATADWLLGPGVQAAHLDARDENNVTFEVKSRTNTAGTVTGILGYMRAHLDPAGGISITNDPTDPAHFRRWHLYHPVEPAIRVEPGDDVTISFDFNQRGHLTTWRVYANGEKRLASQFFGDFHDPLMMFDQPGARLSAVPGSAGGPRSMP